MDTLTHRTVTLIDGDGIGPEVVAATRRIVDACGLGIAWDLQTAGQRVFASGDATGVPAATLASIQRNKVALKGPLETPIGSGAKSANVTLRVMLETYGNIRPARILPGITTPFSDRAIDMVVVRENVEDLYAGIEHMQTADVAQSLKLVSDRGCEKIVRLAFEVARSQGRKSVTCVTKANILKLTEGMLKRVFERVAPDYPGIEPKEILVDNCAHQLVRKPEEFEVLVSTNMNGDILSDLVSGLVGGLGIAPGANMGDHACVFEAVHGTAPDIAGRNLANPTATLLSAVMMLRHIGAFDAADRIEAALALAFEQGVRTGDLAPKGTRAVGTEEFTRTILENLGREPQGWRRRTHAPLTLPKVAPNARPAPTRRSVGVDVFVDARGTPAEIGARGQKLCEGTPLRLKVVTNRGSVVFPVTGAPTECTDHWRYRFVARDKNVDVAWSDVLALLARVGEVQRVVQVEPLSDFGGQRGYSLAQGEE
jgi:isocitrate dehydrogenase